MPPNLPITDPAMASLIAQTLNTQRQASQKFILLILPDNNWPTCEEFDVVQGLVERIKELLGTPCCLFAFLGYRMCITGGPLRYLTTPMGMLALFEAPVPDKTTEDKFGWVGPPMDRPSAPDTETEEVAQIEEAEPALTAVDPLAPTAPDGNVTPMF